MKISWFHKNSRASQAYLNRYSSFLKNLGLPVNFWSVCPIPSLQNSFLSQTYSVLFNLTVLCAYSVWYNSEGNFLCILVFLSRHKNLIVLFIHNKSVLLWAINISFYLFMYLKWYVFKKCEWSPYIEPIRLIWTLIMFTCILVNPEIVSNVEWRVF